MQNFPLNLFDTVSFKNLQFASLLCQSNFSASVRIRDKDCTRRWIAEFCFEKHSIKNWLIQFRENSYKEKKLLQKKKFKGQSWNAQPIGNSVDVSNFANFYHHLILYNSD